MEKNTGTTPRERPRPHWQIRTLIFRLHFWLGAGAMVYVLFVSLTGCAMMFEQELYGFLSPDPPVIPALSIAGARLSTAELRAAARRQYPDDKVVEVLDRRLSAGTVAEIWLEQDGAVRRRLFHPYTGADMGDAHPVGLRVLELLRHAHTALLTGTAGFLMNGLGALALVLLSLSGAVMWLVGAARRRRRPAGGAARRATISTKSSLLNARNFHRAVSAWTFSFAMIWGVTGACFALPSLAHDVFGSSGLSEASFRWLYLVHSGYAGGWPMRLIWVTFGLTICLLAVTGIMMWWNEVARSRLVRRFVPARASAGVNHRLSAIRSVTS
jgi:uncharacterized iron-regulated membrane protein